MVYALLLLGFALLVKGADLLVDGGSALARRSGASELAIGLTVVSVGTSLPELVVNVFASAQGNSELAIGNVLGSNVANILLILGVAALIRALPIHDSTILSEVPFSLAAALLVGFLANAALFSQLRVLSISRLDGLILFSFFGLFLLYVYRVSKREGGSADDDPEDPGGVAGWLRIVAGCAGLALGGRWVVDGALAASAHFGLSETFIGLTAVAIGTSIPELAASSVAAYRGKTDIAVGNVVGSNIFNLLWVLGASALIRPLPFDVVSNTDILMVIFSSTLLLGAVVVGRRPNTIERWEGGVFILVYGAYLAFLTIRG
jgi:cation:H+ antiporter